MQIDKFFPSSQICSNCGVNTGKKALNIGAFICPNCNTYHNRDINASINIRNYALAGLANTVKYLLVSNLSLKQEAHLSFSRWVIHKLR